MVARKHPRSASRLGGGGCAFGPNPRVGGETTQTSRKTQVAALQRKYAAARAAAIRDQLGISETQWAQMLDVLIDQPEAEAAYPTLVRRLRRLREMRAGARGAVCGAASHKTGLNRA